MDALNPLTGRIYLEALEWTRVGRIMCMLMYGKYPHPSTIVPGGMSTTISTSIVQRVLHPAGQDLRLLQGHRRGSGTTLVDFFLDANPAYEEVGASGPPTWPRPASGTTPRSTTPPTPTATPGATSARPSPGIIIEGKLVTTELTAINMGFEEFVDALLLRRLDQHRRPGSTPPTPWATPSRPYHPWNKTTIPQPSGQELQGEVHLGHRPPLGPPDRRDRHLRPDVGHGPGGATPVRAPTVRASPPATACAWCCPATSCPRTSCTGRCPAASTPWSATGPGPTPWPSPPPSA